LSECGYTTPTARIKAGSWIGKAQYDEMFNSIPWSEEEGNNQEQDEDEAEEEEEEEEKTSKEAPKDTPKEVVEVPKEKVEVPKEEVAVPEGMAVSLTPATDKREEVALIQEVKWHEQRNQLLLKVVSDLRLKIESYEEEKEEMKEKYELALKEVGNELKTMKSRYQNLLRASVNN